MGVLTDSALAQTHTGGKGVAGFALARERVLASSRLAVNDRHFSQSLSLQRKTNMEMGQRTVDQQALLSAEQAQEQVQLHVCGWTNNLKTTTVTDNHSKTTQSDCNARSQST